MIYDEFIKKIKAFGNYKEIARRSGISIRTIEYWVYNGGIPPIDKVEIVLNSIGYDIKIKKI